MDRLDQLIVFTAIVDAGSLAAAARRLRRSSPAVTRSLAALEELVGLRLVERTTRRLAPTEAGLRLAERARHLLAEYADAVGKVKENRDAPLEGLLRVTAPSLFGRWHVTPLAASFLDAHPRMRIELVLTNRNLDLIEEGLDAAVRIGPLSESGLVARRVGEVRLVACASPDYLARRGRPRTPKDLIKHDIVFDSHRPSPIIWRFRASGRDQLVRIKPRLMVTDVEAVLLAVKAGHGIGRALSYQVADDFCSGALVPLLPQFEPLPLPVHLVVPTARHMPPRVRAFLDHVSPALSALRVIHQ
jgi:DNA-binding transcriptional LysR family regulator